VTNTVGNVTLFSRAIGNDFEEDTTAPNANIRNYQTNDSTEIFEEQFDDHHHDRQRRRDLRRDRQQRPDHPPLTLRQAQGEDDFFMVSLSNHTRV